MQPVDDHAAVKRAVKKIGRYVELSSKSRTEAEEKERQLILKSLTADYQSKK